MTMGNFNEIEGQFFKQNKISLKEAIDKVNRKTGDMIDYSFLATMYADEGYKYLCEQQISEIQQQLSGVLLKRDDFILRALSKEIEEIHAPKRESDDTRVARKIIDKEKLITSILISDYKFNPIIQINQDSLNLKQYPILFDTTKDFRQRNKEYLATDYYKGGRTVKGYSVISGHEPYISISRADVTDIDLRKHSFLIRREIQNGNFTQLAL